MASKLVVLASSLMLTVAQHQIPLARISPPFSHPGLPHSQLYLTQHANTIMNQDNSIPLTPGALAASPSLINEATQNILSQQARIIGYSPSPGPSFVFVPNQQQQHQQLQVAGSSAPQIIARPSHVFAFAPGGPFSNPAPGNVPQSLIFPVLNNAQQQSQHLNYIPIQTVTLPSQQIPFYQQPANNQPPQHFSKSANSEAVKNVYYDIPPDHPVPLPTASNPQPPSPQSAQQTTGPITEPRPGPKNLDKKLVPPPPIIIGQHTGEIDNQVDYMKPPPPFDHFKLSKVNNVEKFKAPQQQPPSNSPPPPPPPRFNDNPGRHTRQQATGGSELSIVSQKPNSLAELLKQLQTPGNGRPQPAGVATDSATQADSSDSYLQAVTRSQPILSPPPPPPAQSYNRPSYESDGGYSSPSTKFGSVVHKHVFVHAAPDTYEHIPQTRIIRPQVPQEKHINIVFVKSPAAPPPPQTIVELPPQSSSKTVVYILAKKPFEGSHDVKVVGPPPSKPNPPEIFFIRYGERKHNQGYPVPNLQSLYDNSGSYSEPIGVSHGSAGGSSPRSKRNKGGLSVYAPLMAYSTSGQINEITDEEAIFRRTNLDDYFSK